jgi:hypothetical protein
MLSAIYKEYSTHEEVVGRMSARQLNIAIYIYILGNLFGW